jgi:hypothetical protein
MQAYVNGKTIQYRPRTANSEWTDVVDNEPSWCWDKCNYRVKPTVNYRPYSSEVECMHDILTNHFNSWMKVKGENKYFLLNDIGPETNFDLMFRNCEYIDGSPFGIKITK